MLDFEQETIRYYKDRSTIYNEMAGYQKPETKALQQEIINYVKKYAIGRDVLEVACGTGYWTRILSSFAKQIRGLDISQEMIGIARDYCRGIENVTFEAADIFEKPTDNYPVNCIFHHFWWSHIPRAKIDIFNANIRSRAASDSIVVMADNIFNNTYEYYINDNGDRIEIRQLLNTGKIYHVIKNLWDEEQLRRVLGDDIRDFDYALTANGKMWCVSFTINADG